MAADDDNPFRPGFSQAPEVLAGRDNVLVGAEKAVRVALGGRTPRPILLVGARGVGKTVLLTEIANRAGSAHGWPRLRAEATPGASLAAQVVAHAQRLTELLLVNPASGSARFRASEAVLRAGAMGLGGELRFERSSRATPEQDPLVVETALSTLAEAAIAVDTGIILTIDEVQLAKRADLGAIAAALQVGIEQSWPFVVVFAGLPTMRNPDRSVTYFERGEWYELETLDLGSSLKALVIPAQRAGRPFDPSASQYLADQAGGYPYAIQLYGHHAWEASTDKATISLDCATTGSKAAQVELTSGFYAGRWAQASTREREYLVVVAELLGKGEQATSGAIAHQLGVATSQLSMYRDRLLDKGALVVEGNQLRFAVPGMAEYVRKRAPEVRRSGLQELDGRGRRR